MFLFDPSPAISIRAHMSFIANPFQTIPFPWGWSCFSPPGIGPRSASHLRCLAPTDSLLASEAINLLTFQGSPTLNSSSSLRRESLCRPPHCPDTAPPKEIASPCAPRAPTAPSAIPSSGSAPAPAVRFLHPGCLCGIRFLYPECLCGAAVRQTQNPLRASVCAESLAPGTSARPTPPPPRVLPAPAATPSPIASSSVIAASPTANSPHFLIVILSPP